MKGNSPARAGVPPTIRGTPLKLHLTTLMLMGCVCGIKGMACTTSTVELLYSSHSTIVFIRLVVCLFLLFLLLLLLLMRLVEAGMLSG